MNKKLLFLPLLLWTMMVLAETKQTLVPAMIAYGIDGSRHVVELDATDITDLVILPNGQSLSVDIPESQNSGLRSITFAMVATDEVTTSIESTENPIVSNVEKVIRDGLVIIRMQLRGGTIIEYDLRGNQVTNK